MGRTKRQKLKKLVITAALFIVLLTAISAMMIYPNYNKMVAFRKDLDVRSITKAYTINFYRTISPQIELNSYEADFDDSQSLEYLTQEQLLKYRNEGSIEDRLEPKGTRIVIDGVNIDTYVLDGETAHRMDDGPWHFPLSEGPGERGNLVIFGHRFAELPPSRNTFFNLDKVLPGDKIRIVQSGGIEYTYTVIESKVVEKTDRTILSKYGDHRITLITCTPLWTSRQRLVITGILDRAYSNI